MIRCPHCHRPLNIGKLLRTRKPSAKQRRASKANGTLGGRPKKDNPVAEITL